MLTLPFLVPDAALADREARRLSDLTRAAGGLWLRAGQGGPDGWPAATDPDRVAVPAADPPVLAMHRGRRVLQLAAGENRGFHLPQAVPDAGRWSAAILWTSESAAQALLTVRPDSGGNPVHLSEPEPGRLAFRDDNGTAAAALTHGGTDWRLTLLACADGFLRLSQDGTTAEARGVQVDPGPANLLIGCRRVGPRMRKTLGAGRIAEVLLWPGLDILSDPAAAALRDALDEFRRWEA